MNRTKIIAEIIPELRSGFNSQPHYRIWDNGDLEYKSTHDWHLCNTHDNTDLWKENIRKLFPGKRYKFINFVGNLPFERCFREVAPNNNSRIILEVYGFDPIKCPECGSENVKNSRCLDCGEWL